MAESSGIKGKEPMEEEEEAAVPRVPKREVDPNEAGCSYQVSGKREEKSMMALSKRRKRVEPLKPPPGFHFKPTDSELAFNYLLKKQRGEPIPYDCIREVDVYEFHPQKIFEENKKWEAEGKCYFFTTRKLKYRNGDRPARHTDDHLGYWKATGSDKKLPEKGTETVWKQTEKASKKTLVYYLGKAPRGNKTDWVMHEYVINTAEDEKKKKKKKNDINGAKKKSREKQQNLAKPAEQDPYKDSLKKNYTKQEYVKMEGLVLCTISTKGVIEAEGEGGNEDDDPCKKKPCRGKKSSRAASETDTSANYHNHDHNEANLQIIAQGDTVPNENIEFHSENQLFDSESEQFNFENSCYIASTSEELALLDEWDPLSSLEFISNEDNNAEEELVAVASAALPAPNQANNPDLTMPETDALKDSPEVKPRDIDAQ